METVKKEKIAYWTFTILFILPLTLSGATMVLGAQQVNESMVHLGYPLYILKFLGTAKLLGVLAVTTGIYPRIKEWAYAGFTFNLLGAAYSHLESGDGVKAAMPFMILLFMTVSYFLWKKSQLYTGVDK